MDRNMQGCKINLDSSSKRKFENGAESEVKQLKVENGESGDLKKIRVGSRNSQLALFQTNFVVDLLRNHYTRLSYDIVSMTTTGDKILDVALSKIGQKSLFTKELEIALENGEVHVVVHSLKDLPTTLPAGMVIGAICKRENPHDAVVFAADLKYKNLKDLPDGSVIGTSSLRRIAQLKLKYPKLKFENVRGNLNTRLRKLDESKTYTALILAVAGLIRLDLEHRISMILPTDECMYAVGQGALAIECREDDTRTIEILSKISDKDTTLCCIAERSFMRTLEGGCSVPIAANSKIVNNVITLQGGVFSLDGSKNIIDKLSIDCEKDVESSEQNKHYAGVIANHLPCYLLKNAEALGEKLAQILLRKGARDILQEVRSQQEIVST